MFVVGLTGGIASGKSTVATLFSAQGITVIDADHVSREVVAKGSSTLKSIVKHFNETVLNKQGELDRQALRQRIFADEAERQWLENLLHPLIRERMMSTAEASQSPYTIAMIPLLVETLPNPILNRILVVDCDEEQQIQRLMQRDTITLTEAETILQAQASRKERLAHADDVIENTSDTSALKTQVTQLHEKYLLLA